MILLGGVIIVGLLALFEAQLLSRALRLRGLGRRVALAGGTAGGVLGAAAACAITGDAGVDNIFGFLILLAFYGGVIGLPVGVMAGVYVGTGFQRAISGPTGAWTGVILGAACGAFIAGPAMLTLSSGFFERFDGYGVAATAAAIVVLTAATGAHIAASVWESTPWAFTAPAILCLAVFAGLTVVLFPRIALHVQTSRQLQASSDVSSLIARVSSSLNDPRSARGVLVRDIAALGSLGDPRAVPVLARALCVDDWGAPRAAVEALGRIDSPIARDTLLAELKRRNSTLTSQYDDMVARIVFAIGRQKDRRAVPVLISILRPLNVPSTHTYFAPREGLEGVDEDVHIAASQVLASLGDERGLRLVEQRLRVGTGSGNEIRGTLESLLKSGGSGRAEVMSQLRNSPAWATRMYAAEVLGDAHVTAAVPQLISALSDQSGAVQAESAVALGKIGDRRALPALRRASTSQNPRLRACAADAISRIH